MDKNSLNSSNNKIQAAFTLLGIDFNNEENRLVSGKVDYKMKHIRSQNRLLKLRPIKRKHIFFDDEGNSILEKTEEVGL